MNAVVGHIHELNACYAPCKETYQTMIANKNKKIQSLLVTYMLKFMKIGGADVVKSMRAGNTLQSLKLMNNVILHRDTPGIIGSLLTDMSNLYSSNEDDIKAVIKCYFSKCSAQAIELIETIVEVIYNMYSVLLSPVVQAQGKKVQNSILDLIKFIRKEFNDHKKQVETRSTNSKADEPEKTKTKSRKTSAKK
jgi:hypothetical protein